MKWAPNRITLCRKKKERRRLNHLALWNNSVSNPLVVDSGGSSAEINEGRWTCAFILMAVIGLGDHYHCADLLNAKFYYYLCSSSITTQFLFTTLFVDRALIVRFLIVQADLWSLSGSNNITTMTMAMIKNNIVLRKMIRKCFLHDHRGSLFLWSNAG